MSYRIEMDYTPAYELVCSFMVFATKKWMNNLDLGRSWLRRTEEAVQRSFLDKLHEDKQYPLADFDMLYLIIWLRPHGQQDDAESFLHWLRTIDTEELRTLLSPYVGKSPILRHLQKFTQRYVELLTLWNDQYFRHVDPAESAVLIDDFEEKRALQRKLDPETLHELATSGGMIDPAAGLSLVVLTPTLHFRPLNNYCHYNGLAITQYAVDLPPEDDETPPLSLMRLTRALSDESRIRILRFLAEEQRSFTDIYKYSKLSKGTVHHHLIMLRAAGLVCTHMLGYQQRYSIRTEGTAELKLFLESYIRI